MVAGKKVYLAYINASYHPTLDKKHVYCRIVMMKAAGKRNKRISII
jgi:hypothetical protein